jgi:excinuclease UvrABC nuclease subunit
MQNQYLKEKKLPDAPGVYFFKLGKEILYIGKATSLKDRVKSYFGKDLIATRGPLIVDMFFKADKIDFIKTNSVLEALILENNLIKKHHPKYNTKEKDDKSYNYVVITKEEYPRVLIVREKEIKAGLPYEVRSKFGPYPNGGQLKEAMKLIRKIFPYRDKCQVGQKHPCFNFQIGLCPGTCFYMISPRDYLSLIKNIELFLSSKTSQLIKKLERDMNYYAKDKYFEAAKNIRNMIFALKHIQDVALIKEEHNRPVHQNGHPALTKAGKVNVCFLLLDQGGVARLPSRGGGKFRIEAYDAAHLAGTNNVGVMVVMENGELKKSDYRKFKIRNSKGNDLGALKEMLERRLKHTEWVSPDLIVVDGNLNQINVVRQGLSSVLGGESLSVQIVAVTKDDKHKAKAIIGPEDLVKKYKKEILLINNEAHRFVIAFHRKRRSAIL